MNQFFCPTIKKSDGKMGTIFFSFFSSFFFHLIFFLHFFYEWRKIVLDNKKKNEKTNYNENKKPLYLLSLIKR